MHSKKRSHVNGDRGVAQFTTRRAERPAAQKLPAPAHMNGKAFCAGPYSAASITAATGGGEVLADVKNIHFIIVILSLKVPVFPKQFHEVRQLRLAVAQGIYEKK